MKIIKKHIKFNYSKRTDKIKFIVIHDTGNFNKGADSSAHFNYFNSADRQSSAHYFVDDKQVIETVDPAINRSWHCGDGKGKFGITNDNSIGIELCVNSNGNFANTFNNAIELVKHLQKVYNIDNNNVVRHYDASRKNCPNTLINETFKGYNWSKFKQSLNDNNKKVLYRVVAGTYADVNNARKKAEEIGGFIVEYIKE